MNIIDATPPVDFPAQVNMNSGTTLGSSSPINARHQKGIIVGIKDLFSTETPRSPQQDNWLKMVAAIPGAKRAFDDPVTPDDEAVAAEAEAILGGGDSATIASSKLCRKCGARHAPGQNTLCNY